MSFWLSKTSERRAVRYLPAATQSYRNAQNSRTKTRRGFRWVSFNLKFSFCCQGRKSRLALLTGLRGVAMMGYIK
jgi:hypothetical protein